MWNDFEMIMDGLEEPIVEKIRSGRAIFSTSHAQYFQMMGEHRQNYFLEIGCSRNGERCQRHKDEDPEMGEAKFLFEGTILADGSLEDTSSSTAESMGLPKRNPERNTVGSGKEQYPWTIIFIKHRHTPNTHLLVNCHILSDPVDADCLVLPTAHLGSSTKWTVK